MVHLKLSNVPSALMDRGLNGGHLINKQMGKIFFREIRRGFPFYHLDKYRKETS